MNFNIVQVIRRKIVHRIREFTVSQLVTANTREFEFRADQPFYAIPKQKFC